MCAQHFFKVLLLGYPTHTLGALLKHRKNTLFFPPSFDTAFIHQSAAGSPFDSAVITGATSTQQHLLAGYRGAVTALTFRPHGESQSGVKELRLKNIREKH